MTKGLRTTVYAAAALTLAALLVLLLMPAQARYLRAARWQASYSASSSELTSDILALGDDEVQLLLADWSPVAVGYWKQVTFNMTCPAELLQVPAAEDAAEIQPAEPVSVTLGAMDENLQAETQVSCSPNSETGTANITVTLTLTAKAVPESAVEVCIPIRVEITGAENTWFGGELSFALCPAAESSLTVEESGLFNRDACMTEYDPAQPFYVQYTLPAGCTAAEMTLDDGAGFPAGTRFSVDNGATYSVLCEGRPIPVTAGSQSLLVDMSGASPWSGNRTLRLTANGQNEKSFTDTLVLTEKSWSGNAAVTYTEEGLPSIQIQPWNSGYLKVTATVERLEMVAETVQPDGQEDAARQEQTQRTVRYVSVDDVIQIGWTPVNDGEAAAMTKSNSPADAAEAQTMTLFPAEGVSRVPAGTYRVTISWKNGNVLVAQRVIPFFVTR